MGNRELHDEKGTKIKQLCKMQARILEMIETLDDLRAGAKMEIFREVEQDASVIDRIVAAQRDGLAREIEELQTEAAAVEREIAELVGSVPF
jgi:hypothetical protein